MKLISLIFSIVAVCSLALHSTLAEESPFAKLEAGDLLVLKNGKLENYDLSKLKDLEYAAIYFSAHWCPPCRRFTPELVKFYNEKNRPNFEVIFISEDRSEEDMKTYMEEAQMPWPTLTFKRAERFAKAKLANPFDQYSESGIPNLVFIDKDGNVLSASFEDGEYKGPYSVLEEMRKKLK